MSNLEYCVPCLFGLEGPVGDELRRMGITDVRPENGRVKFSGDLSALAAANIRLRCGERVLIELGSFPANSFDQLFEGVKKLPWERFIPANGRFPVKGHCLNSKLFSVPDCQKIVKKAVVSRLGEKYGISWFQEDGETYQIQFSIMKDMAYLYLDTSGTGLHKRGYRPAAGVAPLRETLAAAMVTLARYRGKGDFCDPFCGSGTLPIEAALIAKNRAPGLNRSFSAEQWGCIEKSVWSSAREEAISREFSGEYCITGTDNDPKVLEYAKQNAKRAGVDELVSFEAADAMEFNRKTDRGIIVTNPPYGERIMEKREAEGLYKGFGEALAAQENWSLYLLSSHTEFERTFGKTADKKRKLYNGMIKCELYCYTK